MVRIQQLKLKYDHSSSDLKSSLLKQLRIREDQLLDYKIVKQSLDARKKPELYYVYTIDVYVKNEAALRRLRSDKIIRLPESSVYHPIPSGNVRLHHRPVIIGTGPAGLFCGYLLSLMGYRPILLERGDAMEERMKQVRGFWEGGPLNPESNVQFGEGGAGTFSDGKLNTLVHDHSGRNAYVLQTFVEHGAPPKILYQNKPHIGTDVLRDVIQNMRRSILSHGGEFRFGNCLKEIHTERREQETVCRTITVYDRKKNRYYNLDSDLLILAPGHSARDTFQMLETKRVPMTAKSFAVGVRIEHSQKMIDHSQYGRQRDRFLPAAAYKLTASLENGRGVYTFCMCPGGYVVNASSEPEGLAVNGMSYHDRAGSNANSAVIVTVTPDDFGGEGPLCGMYFQRSLEQAAYLAGKGNIPVQKFGDFCSHTPSTGPGTIHPQMKGRYTWTDLHSIFPEFIAESLKDGILKFDRKIKGYADPDAVISAVESRTSSPVRILRDETFQSEIRGIYPCGEGAGYAGGIMSAAMDGLKVAEKIAEKYASFDKHESGLRNI